MRYCAVSVRAALMATSFAQPSEGVSAVSPLFGNKENPAAERRQVDIERLLDLPVAALAAQILPLWASGEISPVKLQQGEYAANEVASWLAGSKPNALFLPTRHSGRRRWLSPNRCDSRRR